METTLNFKTIQPKMMTDVLVSVFEGLQPGHQLRLICDQNPSDVMTKIDLAALKNYQWQAQKSDDLWEVYITKDREPKKDGCCGICGGHGE